MEAELEVPAGTSRNAVLRMRGKGIRGFAQGRGDVLVRVNVRVPTKRRQGEEALRELGRWTANLRRRKVFFDRLKSDGGKAQ